MAIGDAYVTLKLDKWSNEMATVVNYQVNTCVESVAFTQLTSLRATLGQHAQLSPSSQRSREPICSVIISTVLRKAIAVNPSRRALQKRSGASFLFLFGPPGVLIDLRYYSSRLFAFFCERSRIWPSLFWTGPSKKFP